MAPTTTGSKTRWAPQALMDGLQLGRAAVGGGILCHQAHSLLELRMMEVMVTTAAIEHAKLQLNHLH